MKKTKLIALTMVVALMMVGAGYAAWTDNLVIGTTLNTGNLDVHFVDLENETELNLDPYVTGHVGYNQDGTGDNDWDIANVAISNLYPGAKADVTLWIENNSTLPVKMNSITDSRSSYWGANGVNFEQIGATLRFFDSNGVALAFDNTTTYANPWEPAHLTTTELPIGGHATLTFNFKASDTIDENATYVFNAEAIFKQFNK